MKTAEEFLKTELDKIDKNAFWEIDGYGNVDDVVNVMEEYANQSKRTCKTCRIRKAELRKQNKLN